mgnify:FL=1
MQNRTSGSTILGGYFNLINCNQNSIIAGGIDNCISGYNYSGYLYTNCNNSILGGKCNTICETDYSAIVGGCYNTICTEGDNFNSIVGGRSNTICSSTDFSVIIGGRGNKIASYSADADYSVIVGGECNYNCASQGSVILGGYYNRLYYYSYCSAITAGVYNCLLNCSERSVIVGGYNNCMDCGVDSSIIGGFSNKITCSFRSAIIGGQNLTLNSENDKVLVPQLKIDYISSGISDTKILMADSQGVSPAMY